MYLSSISFQRGVLLALAISVGPPAACSNDTADGDNGMPPPDAAAPATAVSEGASAAAGDRDDEPGTVVTDKVAANRIAREGVIVEFSATPVNTGAERIMAADWADVTFRITDEETGAPIKGRYPAAWMDLAKAWEAKGDKPMSCDQRVQTYLQGIVGVRPMIDLNSHFLLVLNADASISVIDPIVGITGVTNLFAQINIEQAGADWAKTEDQKQLFVTMPLANQVAFIDTDHFKVIQNIDAGERPTRVELQPDERYLWIGNNATDEQKSGVTIIDVVDKQPVAFIATGAGHHEIAFSENDRYAFVSNRNAGTVSVIDVQKQKKVKDIRTGEMPIALAYSTLGKAAYVVDARSGEIAVIDGESLEVRSRPKGKPGLGPMRFAIDGRWGMVVNPSEDTVSVLDASKDELVHTVEVGNQPYQVTFTRSFAYIRSLGTENVGLIPLSELDKPTPPPVTYVVAGMQAPGAGARISVADSVIPSVKEAAVYIVNQADGTVHYYMEGMVAPMGAFRNYGHEARAIEIVDRSLTERQPGVYTGRVKLPIEGEYDVAFMMDSPRFLHCFSAEVVPNPAVKPTGRQLSVDFLAKERFVPANSDIPFRFKLVDAVTGEVGETLDDVTVLYYRSDGLDRNVVAAKPVEGGVYEATIRLNTTSVYYVFVSSRSAATDYSDLPFFSIKSVAAPVKERASGTGSGGEGG